MARKKAEPERLLLFELKLWGTTALVATMNANAARHLLSDGHHFRGAWVNSPSVAVEMIGYDTVPGRRQRASGKRPQIIRISHEPIVKTPPLPESAFLSGAEVHSGSEDRD